MGCPRFLHAGLLALLCLASGCGTVGRLNPVTWFRGQDHEQSSPDQKLADHNPFRRNQSQPAAEDDRGEPGEGPDRIDPELQQHIDAELADATPEERDRLLKDFESLDPLVIKQLLKLRRMRLDLERQEEQLAAGSDQTAGQPYQGLGTAYPGREPQRGTEFASAAAQRSTAGSAFGHSQSFGQNASPAEVEQTARGGSPPTRRRIDLNYDNGSGEFQGGELQGGSHFAGTAPSQETNSRPADVATVAFQTSQPPPGVAPRDQDSAMRFGDPAQSGDFTQYGMGNAMLARAEQPGPAAELNASLGFQELPPDSRGSAAGLISRQGAAPQQVPPVDPQWRQTLEQMILAAEEQAYSAQTAWEQAEQLPPAENEADETARRKLIEARRQDYVEKQVHLRMLYLMAGQQARALERIRGLEPADQEFWKQVMWALANYFDVEGFPSREARASKTITELRSAIQHLQQTAKLEIRKVDFCRQIFSFGNYEKYPDVFRPGSPVMVYAEIENFTSERGSDNLYRTQLKSTIEIHRIIPNGSDVIKTIEFKSTTDVCRSHRRDYYHSYDLRIPDRAPPGSYALVLIVEDELSQRVATYSRNFTIE